MKSAHRYLIRFFVFTFIWTWAIFLPFVLFNQGILEISEETLSKIQNPFLVLGAFGPLFGVLLTLPKEQGKGANARYLKTFLNLRLGWKAYVFAVLILGGLSFTAWILPEAFGHERLSMLLPSIWLFPPYLLLMILLGGGQEEFGWRGYALPRLEKIYGIWIANLILGILWGIWHLPLWFIEGTSQIYMNFGAFMLFTIGSSYILSWIMSLSGNKPFAGLYAHGLSNALVPLLPTIILEANVPQPQYWTWVLLTLLAGVLITLLRGLKSNH